MTRRLSTLESKQRIGLYGSGEVPRSKRLTSKAVGPRSNGLRFLSDLPPVRRVRPARFSTKGVAAAAIVPLVVIMAIVTAFALATSLAPVQTLSAPKQLPPPYTIYGYVWQSDGTTPVLNTPVKLTNLRTGLSVTTATDDTFGAYAQDITMISGTPPASPLPGDEILVEAGAGGSLGSSLGVVPTPIGPGFRLDVTTGVFIPEFSELALPIVGMLGLVVATVAVTRSKKNE